MRHLLLLLVAACAVDPGTPPGAPTWHADIAPLVAVHCAGCHSPGALAGRIPLDAWPDAAPWAATMAIRTTERTMPPFLATESEDCPNPWGWTNDRRLADDEIALFAAWSEAGAPEGVEDPAVEIPEPVLPEPLDRVDQELGPKTAYEVPARTTVPDAYVCWVVDAGLLAEGQLEGVEVVPDAREVVHHVLVGVADASIDALVGPDGWYECPGGLPGTMVGGWVPGAAPIRMPEGTAVRVPAGSRVVVQMHYHGIDTSIPDATRVRFQWADGDRRLAFVNLYGNASRADQGLQPGPGDRGAPEFRIPAEAAGHTETMRFPIDEGGGDYGIFMVANHMHRVGSRMRVWVESGSGGADTCLLDTPAWDFDWQLLYTYDVEGGNAPVVHDGDTLVLECTYDNTLAHPGTQIVLAESGLDRPVDVALGEGTLDEMCIFVAGAVPL